MINFYGQKCKNAAIELTRKKLREMQVASAQIKVVGSRYTEQMEKSTGL